MDMIHIMMRLPENKKKDDSALESRMATKTIEAPMLDTLPIEIPLTDQRGQGAANGPQQQMMTQERSRGNLATNITIVQASMEPNALESRQQGRGWGPKGSGQAKNEGLLYRTRKLGVKHEMKL